MDVPQHVALTVGRFIVLVAAIRNRIVILWAAWDGSAANYQVIDLEARVDGPLIVHGCSSYLCVLCTFKRDSTSGLNSRPSSLTNQDSAPVHDKGNSDISQTIEESIGAITIDLSLLICGNNWEEVCFESQLRCAGGLASVWSMASYGEQLFVLTKSSIIQGNIISIGGRRRLVVQDIHSHFLHDVLPTQKPESGGLNSLRMNIHVDNIGDVFVAIYDSFLYIQRISEGNTALYYDSTKDSKWQEAFIKYRRLSILRVENLHDHDSEDQKSKGPAYCYLIVGSPGILVYMTWCATSTTFVTLLEAPLTARSEYTGCVRCADNLLLLNHRQQKVFCAKRVELKSESMHTVPAFVEAPVAVPDILNSESVIFRLDLVDFNPRAFPLSILISYNGDGITCHCIDPATDTASQRSHSFLPIYKSFPLHKNKDCGPVYELKNSLRSAQNTGQLVTVSFSRYHLFRRLEFYWDTVLDGLLCDILPVVVNYYKEGAELTEKRLHLPALPLNVIENVRKDHNSVINFQEKLAARLHASCCVYGDYLMTIHSTNEAHEFAGPLLRQWLYSHTSFDFGPLFAAAYYLLTTDLRTGSQHWLPLPFRLPHLRFEIASTHIAESDYMGKRVPELSMIIRSLTMHSKSVLLCRCVFKEGRTSLLTGDLNSLVLSVTNLGDLINRCSFGQQLMAIHAGSNSSYVFVTPDCCAIELYHDLSDGGASYEEIRPLQHRLHGVIYKQLCATLVCQLSRDYERTLTPTESDLCVEGDISAPQKGAHSYLTIGGNPSRRVSILNGAHGQRFYCIVFIGEKKMFGPSAPSLSTDRSLAIKSLSREELKWYQLVRKLDDNAPLALGLVLLSYRSRKVARIYKFPILAHLQRGVLSIDRETSICDYFDAIMMPLARRDAYIGLVNLSTANTINDWVLVCILEKHICVYSAPLGTILALEQAHEGLGPILGVQGFAWLDGAAIYIHGRNSSQLVSLVQRHRLINKT